MNEHPSYYSVIPATVRYDHRLKPNEKLLFGEITALSNVKGYCYSTNKYFSKLYEVTVQTVSEWINHLKGLGYLKVEMIKDGKAIKERHLYPVVDAPIQENLNRGYSEKAEEGIQENLNRGIREKPKENITSINTTSKNKSSSTARDSLDNSTKDIESGQNAFELYQITVGILTPMQSQLLSEYIHKLSDEVVGYAINLMANQTERRSFNYLNRILMRYESMEIDTVEKAKKLEEKRQSSVGRTKAKQQRKSRRKNTLPF